MTDFLSNIQMTQHQHPTGPSTSFTSNIASPLPPDARPLAGAGNEWKMRFQLPSLLPLGHCSPKLQVQILLLPMATIFSLQTAEPDRSSCGDTFDIGLRRQCMRGEWEEKYYFEHQSQTCRLFWYDGCPSSSGTRNFFDSLMECQWLCEPGQKAVVCLEPFDEHLRDECQRGEWHRRFYFDRNRLRCVPFWFDGCESGSRNQFDEEKQCMEQCEMPATLATKKLASRPSSTPASSLLPAWRMVGSAPVPGRVGTKPTGKQKKMSLPSFLTFYLLATWESATGRSSPHILTRPSRPAWQTALGTQQGGTFATTWPSAQLPPFNRSTQSWMKTTGLAGASARNTTIPPLPQQQAANLCARANPCQNNGTCVWDGLAGQHVCQCAPGFTNDNCTERIDFDPCSPDPCKNGATCAAKASPIQSDFDCFCAKGFAGRHCEFRPCEENPCKNGGTCRTTRAATLFFCACPPFFSGKTCMIAIPPSAEVKDGQPDANFTQQLSSGKIEWIEHLQRITPEMPSKDEPKSTERNDSSMEREYSPVSSAEDALVSRRSKDAPSAVPELIVEENPTRTLKGSTSGGEQQKSGAKMNQNEDYCGLLALLTLLKLYRFIL